MKVIVSTQNKEVRAISKLHTSKGRQNQRRFIVEGYKSIQAIIEIKAIKLVQIYATQDWIEKIKSITTINNITLVSEMVIKKISTANTPSGVVGIFDIPEKPNVKEISSGIVLVQISDPGNMGTLIRTAAAMNYKTVIIIEGCDPWSPKVIQSTAGTVGNLNIFQITWKELLENKKSLILTALVINGGEAPDKINKDSLIVVGNESHGLPEEWGESCEQKITLPMPGNTESLNVAVAGSIALYLANTKRY